MNGTRRDEAGAVAVMVALLLMGLLIVSAFVLDLGALRADRVEGKAIADMAAAAAVVDYNSNEPGEPLEACRDALAFAVDNLDEVEAVGSLTGDPACDAILDDSYACTPGDDALQAIYTQPDLRIEITLPVPNEHELMGEQDIVLPFDGRDCDRVGVRIERDRSYLLAPVAGFLGGTTTPSAVGRSQDFEEERASLIILEEFGCESLDVSGEVRIEGTDTRPGIITVDTLPEDCADGDVIHRQSVGGGGGSPLIEASHRIFSYALLVDPGNANQVYTAHERLRPTPTPGQLLTRAPIDHNYNCLEDYNDYSSHSWSPAWDDSDRITADVEGCNDNGESYLQDLYDAYQPLDADSLPAGWSVLPDDDDDDVPSDCRETGGPDDYVLGPEDATGGGDGKKWFIDCPDDDDYEPRSTHHFKGVDAVVVAGEIDYGTQGELQVTGGDDGAVLYLKGGSLDPGNSTLTLTDTFVYIDDGVVDAGGNPDVTWLAPLESTSTCDTSGAAPSGGCFAPLALWSNSGSTHRLSGSGTLDVTGVFFTPNASPFHVFGTSGQDMEDAQFFTGRLRVQGDATLRMTPDPASTVETPFLHHLIR